jgi:hypothetical protein
MAEGDEKHGPLAMDQREVDAMTTGRASAAHAFAKRLSSEAPSKAGPGMTARSGKAGPVAVNAEEVRNLSRGRVPEDLGRRLTRLSEATRKADQESRPPGRKEGPDKPPPSG